MDVVYRDVLDLVPLGFKPLRLILFEWGYDSSLLRWGLIWLESEKLIESCCWVNISTEDIVCDFGFDHAMSDLFYRRVSDG